MKWDTTFGTLASFNRVSICENGIQSCLKFEVSGVSGVIGLCGVEPLLSISDTIYSVCSAFGAFVLISMTYPEPNLSLMCCGVPKHLKTPPLTMIPRRVLSASASSIECVVKTNADDLLCARSATTFHIKRRASGSIPAEGSSRRITGGDPKMAIATDNFRLLPPERFPANFLRYSSKSIF